MRKKLSAFKVYAFLATNISLKLNSLPFPKRMISLSKKDRDEKDQHVPVMF
jgi:hypothetical protein